jgi:hypothetical protein
MGNDITRNPIYVDTVGVVATKPLWIKKIVLVPTATTATAVLKYWEEDEESVRTTKRSQAVAVTGTNNIESTGNFTATTEAVATDAIKIFEADESANVGTWEIASVSTPNSITVSPAITNDASGTYSWKVYASYPFASLNNATFPPCQMDFAKPVKVPNLMVTTLTTGTLYIYL